MKIDFAMLLDGFASCPRLPCLHRLVIGAYPQNQEVVIVSLQTGTEEKLRWVDEDWLKQVRLFAFMYYVISYFNLDFTS